LLLIIQFVSYVPYVYLYYNYTYCTDETKIYIYAYNMLIYIYAVLPPTIAKLVIISSILVNYGLFIGTTNQIRSGGAPPLVTDHYLDLLSGSSLGIFPVLTPLIGESTGNVFTFSDTI
jgi:hypothetical protein